MHVGVDEEAEVEWDSNSSTLYNEEDGAKERKQCWSGGMESADARKAAKAERKAANHQVLFEVITQEDLTRVERALHPESEQRGSAVSKGQGLADNQTIDENIAFNASTFKWSGLRQGVHAKRIAKNNGGKPKANTPQQENEILSPIFASLGITTNLTKASKERKSLDAKLRTAILGDLVAFKNDQVETMQRMAGYWRYANKRTYNEMIRNNEIWDWATGERLPEIREEALDAVEEEDEIAEEGRIPENWDDPDFELPTGDMTLSLTSSTLTKQSDADRETKLDKELESTRDGITSTMSKLSLNPGRFINQTPGFNVLSPDPSDEDWQQLGNESGNHTTEDTETLHASRTSRSPLSPINSNRKDEKAFQGIKDTRIFAKSLTGKASPSVKDPPPTPQPTTSLLAPAAAQSHINTPDHRNRFGALNNETPAPCEEIKKPDPGPLVIKIPAKPIIKTLAIHDEQDDWKTQLRPKQGKKGAKGGAAMALREQAAVNNVHARKFAEGKNFAAAVKKGL